MNAKTLLKALICASFAAFTIGCEKEDPSGNGQDNAVDSIAKKFLLNNFSHYYYWNKEVNDRNSSINPDNLSVETYFDKLLYSSDRWSWMCDAESYISSQTGVYSDTWGVSFGQTATDDGDYSVKVRYIYPGSPLSGFGVTRGARLNALDGVSLDPFTEEKRDYFQTCINEKNELTFTFRLENGKETTFTAKKANSLSTSPVLKYGVIDKKSFPGLGEDVGYLLYLSFKSNFNNELSHALEEIGKSGVKKMILDLRYNGGGDLTSIEKLLSYIAPRQAAGKEYLKVQHNDDLAASLDKSYFITANDLNLDLEDIYIITGNGCASASEVTINSLRPFYGDRIHLVGKASYGKPNGMYALLFPGTDEYYEEYSKGNYSRLIYAFLPICFYNMNSEGEQIPDNGFAPDLDCMDDLYHDFGVNELNIRACLNHIATGSFPDERAAVRSTKSVCNGALIENEWNRKDYGTMVLN